MEMMAARLDGNTLVWIM